MCMYVYIYTGFLQIMGTQIQFKGIKFIKNNMVITYYVINIFEICLEQIAIF